MLLTSSKIYPTLKRGNWGGVSKKHFATLKFLICTHIYVKSQVRSLRRKRQKESEWISEYSMYRMCVHNFFGKFYKQDVIRTGGMLTTSEGIFWHEHT